MDSKRCSSCKQVKPLDKFHRSAWRRAKAGRHHQCKACRTRGKPGTFGPGQRWAQFLELAALETDECVIWPGAMDRHGYGKLHEPAGGRCTSPHRLALERRLPCPPDKEQAAHGPCHNRLCINYRHLYWATRKENMADMERDGTKAFSRDGKRHSRAKLQVSDVLVIRSRRETGWKLRELADEFGVNLNTIHLITTGKTWRNVA